MPYAPLIPARKRIAIIRNPVSGRSTGIFERTLSELEALKVDYQVMCTQRAGEGRELARRVAGEPGWDAVAAAGGDGTCNEVASGILGASMPMGIIPTGTVNVLAAEIGQTPEPQSIAHTLAHGVVRPICIGKINDRVFMLMVGVGWDARVVAAVSSRLKSLLGRWAYAVQAVRLLWDTPSTPLQVGVGGNLEEGTWAIVCNAGYYGGRYRIAPLARLEDPALQVLIFNSHGPWERMRDLLALRLGRPGLFKSVRSFMADRVHIAGSPSECVQIDGDLAGNLPAEISIASSRLNLILPPGA